MRRNFFVVEFLTAEGWQFSRTFTQVRNARKWRAWLAQQTWCNEARVMRGGPGGELVV